MITQVLRRVRHLPDRMRHGGRRRAALEALALRPRPRLILVVCHGNICRSPFAAAALRQGLSTSDIRVVSAGFVGSDRPAPPEASAVAAGWGLDLSAHRSQPLLPDVVQSADLIIVMDSEQQQAICLGFGRLPRDVIVLGDLDSEAIETRGIHDPISQPAAIFRTVYTRIQRCVEALAGIVSALPGGDELSPSGSGQRQERTARA